MADATKQWTKFFGGPRTFWEEVVHAREVGAEWLVEPGQRDIIVDAIPGWLPPMWGSDDAWLYLRRPEGVWKVKAPDAFAGDTLISVYARRGVEKKRGKLLGGMIIGSQLLNMPGWIRGRDLANPMPAAARDELAFPSRRGFDVDADTVASSWGKVVSSRPGELVLDGGDHFNAVPVFELRDGWLIARDRLTGHRVAYQLSGAEIPQRIHAGAFAFRFSSPWFDEFVAPVKV